MWLKEGGRFCSCLSAYKHVPYDPRNPDKIYQVMRESCEGRCLTLSPRDFVDLIQPFPIVTNPNVRMNTVKHSNGETLTGRLWRKDHSFFFKLPFYSEILRMDRIVVPLQEATWESSYKSLLIVRSIRLRLLTNRIIF